MNWMANLLLLAQNGQAAESVSEAGEAAAQTGGVSGWLVLAFIVGIFVVPIALGNLLGRLLKMQDVSSRISVVLFAVFLGISPFGWHLFAGARQGLGPGESLQNAVRLGIDLKGGTNLIFEVDHEATEKEVTDAVMDQMVGAIAKRINPSGVEEVTVRRVGFDRVEVIIPGVDRSQVELMKDRMTRLGSLEFAILANQRDHAPPRSDIIPRAQQLDPEERDLRDETGRIIASWREVGTDDEGRPKDVGEHGGVVTRTGRTNEQAYELKEFLVVFERPDRRVTGQFLAEAYPQVNQETGGLAVGFRFNAKGGRRFYALTRKYGPTADGSFKRRLAILLDGKVHSAPQINEPIRSQGQISGQFSRKEVDELISVLNAGALEVPIKPEPINELTVGPTLAHDVQTKGVTAIAVAGMTVIVFMLAYYWFAGFVAVTCLVLNLILVIGTMSFIDATFTLPGLAGLVLTIGMAVDANVLIFERIREESNRGSSLRMAIQNGFGRAFSAIVDANVTTLITAVVLYMIGTDQVRGFAVTLFIGIVMSMFTALYFGRLVFDVFERKRWLKGVRMLSIVGETHWNFISKKAIAAVFSVVLIAGGMATLFARGQRNLDIDFTGGTMVTFETVQPQKLQDVRNALEQVFDSVSLERLTIAGQQEQGDVGTRFRMRTTTRDADLIAEFADEEGGQELTVQELLARAFEQADIELRHVTPEMGSLTRIPGGTTTGDGDAPPGPEGIDEKYHGGYQAEFGFSDDISTATAASYLIQELRRFETEEGFDRYEQPGNLISFIGLESSGPEAQQQNKFNRMRMLVTGDVAEAELRTALEGMLVAMETQPLLEEVNSFAGSVATEMQQSAVMAMLASLIAIIAYIWFRFQRITFGLAAVAALVHDVLVVLGMVALASYAYTRGFQGLGLEEFKINLPMIAAFLTIVGYSLNDTIVVFDRVREVRGKNPALTTDMVNTSLNQTLSRTLLTSLTTLIVVVILYLFGGEGLHGFAFCLVIGVLVGTYSSMYVASPVLLWLMNRGAPQTAAAGGRN